MKWYDYVVIILIADMITAYLLFNPIMVWLPILSYYFYEDFRKEQVTKQSD